MTGGRTRDKQSLLLAPSFSLSIFFVRCFSLCLMNTKIDRLVNLDLTPENCSHLKCNVKSALQRNHRACAITILYQRCRLNVTPPFPVYTSSAALNHR